MKGYCIKNNARFLCNIDFIASIEVRNSGISLLPIREAAVKLAREAGYDVKALAAAISGPRGQKHANRGEPSGVCKAQEPVATEDAGSDSGSPDIAPAA